MNKGASKSHFLALTWKKHDQNPTAAMLISFFKFKTLDY